MPTDDGLLNYAPLDQLNIRCMAAFRRCRAAGDPPERWMQVLEGGRDYLLETRPDIRLAYLRAALAHGSGAIPEAAIARRRVGFFSRVSEPLGEAPSGAIGRCWR